MLWPEANPAWCVSIEERFEQSSITMTPHACSYTVTTASRAAKTVVYQEDSKTADAVSSVRPLPPSSLT